MTIEPRTDKAGNVISYRLRACVGRDAQHKQIWRTTTIPRPEGLTPKKEEAEVKRQADAWEQEQRAEYERTNSKEDLSKISFAAFVHDIWWPQHVMDGSHKPTSISFYHNLSESVVEYFERDRKKLNQITAGEVKRFIVYLQTQAKSKSGEPLSQTTIIRNYQTLRNILNFAVRFGYLKDDPCKNLSVKDKPRQKAKTIDFLDPKEARRFMQALESEPLFWRTFATLLIHCGLRRGEAVGLQWQDINSEELTITISRNITVNANVPEKYSVETPKSGESRVVPLPGSVYALLQSLKREQETRYNAKLLPNAFIFCRTENPYAPIYPTVPTRWQARFIKRNGLPNMSPHDLRHTAATLALEAGADLKDVQTLLGHKDPSTTMAFYAGVSEEKQRRTVEGIEKILSAK